MRALLSVYDKTGIVELARGLIELGYELISTGGTMRALSAAGVPALQVATVTGSPEILDGRVKTLHPAIHGALLARRDDPAHLASLADHDITPIDLVAVNLYPFAETIAGSEVTINDAIEQIDIGGPTMIRAAAKNFPGVIVLTNPADYQPALDALRVGPVPLDQRRQLAARAFAHVAAYDTVVAAYLGDDTFPAELTIAGDKAMDLRYGENPQQRAAAYRRRVAAPTRPGVLEGAQLAGKALSFNNLLDADAAWNAATAFADPTVAIIKHAIPCGLASRDELEPAFAAALAGDPVSAFGGIVAANRRLDGATARQIVATFFEVIIAPGFDSDARDALAGKKQLRLLDMPAVFGPDGAGHAAPWDVRLIGGGFLVQEADAAADDPADWTVVTERQPSPAEWDDLRFAWQAVRFVKSNAIVLVRERTLVGVGSGQPNRLVSVRLAATNAGERATGATLASDAFFPFADGIEAAVAAGVTAFVQPGGSVRDAEVIAAADAAGVSMVFTGTRHFRH